MKLYTDTSHYEGHKDWKHVPHVIRPFFERDSETDRLVEMYLSRTLQEADYAVLPMTPEYYLISNKQLMMESFIKQAREAGKPIIVFNDGDAGVRYPFPQDVIVLRQNAYQSRRKSNEYGNSFIVEEDPMREYLHQTGIVVREKREKPVVGFDGLGGETLIMTAYHTLVNLFTNIKCYTHLSIYEPNKLLPGTTIRSKALDFFERDGRIAANFNRRSAFRAGAKTPEDQRQKTTEFYKNMMESDYVLCVRGGGNFSKRFYETLAMGRIPVFINTDCVLPFDNIIDWKKFVVWVEQSEIKHIADKLVEFHKSITNDEFKAMQRSCRELWEKHLNREGVLSSLGSLIQQSL